MSTASQLSSSGQKKLGLGNKRDRAHQEEIQTLKSKFEERMQRYELIIHETIDQIQKLELDMSERTTELQLAVSAKNQYSSELAVKERQIDELTFQLRTKDDEISNLKKLMKNSLETSADKLDLERQKHEIDVMSLRRTISLQQNELSSVRKQCLELEYHIQKLKGKLKSNKESYKSLRSSSRLKSESKLQYRLSNRKLKGNAENSLGHWSTREAIVSNLELGGVDDILEPINLDEGVFTEIPRINFSEICKTPSKSLSPKISKFSDTGEVSIEVMGKLAISTPRFTDRIIVDSSSVPNKDKHQYSINRYVSEMDPLDREIQEIIRRHPCKNERCLCDRKISIKIPSTQDASSICGFLWNVMKTVAVNVTKLVVWDRLDDLVDKHR